MPKPVPHVKHNLFTGIKFMLDMRADYLSTIAQLHAQHGDMFSVSLGGDTLLYSLFKPEHVRDVLIKNAPNIRKNAQYTDMKRGMARFFGTGLITSEGDFWKRQRKMAAPAFHTQRVNAYADTMVNYAQTLVDTWHDGMAMNIADEMNKVTLKIISYTLFHDIDPRETESVIETLAGIQKLMSDSDFMPDFIAAPMWAKADELQKRLDDVVYPIIQQYRAHGQDRGDLISMLMLTEAEDGTRMTDKELRDELVALLLAGHETTANTLNWTFYLLSQHPHIEAQLHAELDQVLGGKLPTLADLRQLPYTQMVIKESMRLYPAAPGILREALTDIQVGEYVIPQGGQISIAAYITQRSPQVWENPLVFEPQRFSAENESHIDKWAYYPFGGGQRICLGNSFAMMEAPLLLATIGARYRLQLAPRATVKPKASITLFPEGGIQMIAHARHTERNMQPQLELAAH